jgi:hypothetical protein
MKKKCIQRGAVVLACVIVLIMAGLVTACFPKHETGTIPPITGTLTFTPSKLTAGTVGQPYQVSIAISGNISPVGQMQLSSGSLPPGLEMSFVKGTDKATISGMPQKTGTYLFAINVMCMGTNQGGQTGTCHYELVIQ